MTTSFDSSHFEPLSAFKNWGSIFPDQLPPKGFIDVSGCEGSLVPESAVAAAKHYFDVPRRVTLHSEAQDRVLRRLVAELHGVTPGNVFITAASLDGLRYIADLFFRRGVRVGLLSPDFPPYPALVQNCGATLKVLPTVGPNLVHDVEDVLDFVRAEQIDVLMFSNPSVCTGLQRSTTDIQTILDRAPCLCVVDEADAMSLESAAALTKTYDNVVVLRSFSKWYGLADLRLGYMVVPDTLAVHADRRMNVCGVSGPSIAAGCAAVRDSEYLASVSQVVEANRTRFAAALAETPYSLVPGSRCFVSFITGEGAFSRFWEAGVVLNAGTNYALESFVGLPQPQLLVEGGRINFTNSAHIDSVISRVRADFRADA